MSSIKLCIFDLDGTLLETQASIARAVNKTLQHFGLPAMPVQNFNYYAGDGLDNSLRRALVDAGDPEMKYFEPGREMCHRWFEEDPLYQVKPYPHIKEMLRGLKERRILCGVLSNKPDEQVTEVIRHFFEEDGRKERFFEYLRGVKPGGPLKPHPGGVYEILQAAGVKKGDCLYFGDTNTDMKTAHNAGLFAVGVSWGFRPKSELIEYRADAIIDDPLEILELVDARFSAV